MYELQSVSFHNDTVYLVNNDGVPYFPVRPLVENMGLTWQGQHIKLTTQKKWSTVTMITTVAADGKQRKMLCLPLRKLPAFLYSIEADKVRPDLKEKVEIYQEECDEVLWNYWTKGFAINQRFGLDTLREVIRQELATCIHPRRAAAKPVSAEEAARMREYILAGHGTTETARLTGRSVSTVKAHTWEERRAMAKSRQPMLPGMEVA